MKVLKLLLASGAILASATIASAEMPRPVPDKAAADLTAAPSGTAGSLSNAGAVKATTRLVAGWNTVHAYSCLITKSGTVYTLKVYSLASEGVWFSTTLPQYQNILSGACAAGNWVSFYITKLSTGTWTSMQVWSYK